MITKEESLRQSVVINSLRLPATILVIASHCVVSLSTKSIPLSLSSENLFLMLEYLCLSFGPVAVSLFSLITGYFFFFKLKSYNFSSYKTEVGKTVPIVAYWEYRLVSTLFPRLSQVLSGGRG